MGAQHILHIFDGDFAFRLASPRNIVGNRLMIGILTIPLLVVRVEEALHVPGTRSVVHVVGIGVGAERVTRVERSGILHRQVKMVAFDELGQIGGAHVSSCSPNASSRSNSSMPSWFGMVTYASSGTRLAIQ